MLSLQVSACLMGNFFNMLRVSRDWCVSRGTEPVVASEYLASLYQGIAAADVKRVCSLPEGYDQLVAEQTPGGFNEQIVSRLREKGVYDAYVEALDDINRQFEEKL